jgi:hypothetical protein
MDNLFKALPRDLQWEILSEFVGTHTVRNGKLMRKLDNKIKDRLKVTSVGCSKELWLKPYCILCSPTEYNNYMIACVWFHSGNLMKICDNPNTREIRYVYSKPYPNVNDTPQKPITSVLDDSVILPPFEKHTYPSYPYTNKKKAYNKINLNI